MKIAVIGGVSSTKLLIEKLSQHGFNNIHVWGYAPENTSRVSGWSDLRGISESLSFRYTPFVRVSDCKEELTDFAPDLIFAVGLSQIIPEDILSVPRMGCIGFHPTALPRGRGRAPLAWLILEGMDGAASFFLLRKGVDDGPIVAQAPFLVDEHDDAASVETKLLIAEAAALDAWLPQLAFGEISGKEQDHSRANWYGRRAPEDGWLDWNKSAEDLYRLIRASTAPHPGAYTFYEDAVITIWAAELNARPEKGVVGRILQVFPDQSFLIQCTKGLLHVKKWQATNAWQPKVGIKLGYYTEAEIYKLRIKNARLEERLERLEGRLLDALRDQIP